MAKKRKKQQAPESEANTETLEETTAEESVEAATGKTANPLAELQNAIETANTAAAKNWDLYLRERADLENARKRHQRGSAVPTRAA